ncbi:MAG: 30S ribosomal protein S20 [Clostridia bacterium]|nr:30S ribosomal protein S20 [Clostridia bacterium]
MPNIKSAKKRVLVNQKKNAINKSGKSEVKTAMKKLNATIEAGDYAQAEACYREVCSILDKAVAKGLLHKNTAANKKSGFAVRINALKA